MADQSNCRQCGAPLPVDQTTGGECPRCILNLALDTLEPPAGPYSVTIEKFTRRLRS